MNMIKTAIAATALAFALSTGAVAQTPPATTTAPPSTSAPATPAVKPVKPAKVAKPKAEAKPRSDVSIACSAEMDAKNIHGKERSKMMKTCKAAGPKAATATTPAKPATPPAATTTPPAVKKN